MEIVHPPRHADGVGAVTASSPVWKLNPKWINYNVNGWLLN